MNIVIITTHYPTLDKNCKLSPADHYYAREWIKSGHNVLVFHLRAVLFGFSTNCNLAQYIIENVQVYYVKYLRIIPKSPITELFSTAKVAKMVDSIIQNHFKHVDLFYCDFCAGNWQVIQKLRVVYTNSVFFPVFNNCDFYSIKLAKSIIESSVIVGVRSKVQKEKVLSIIPNKTVIIAYSGAPFIEQVKQNNVIKKQYSIIYAGDLIPLKNVDILIESIYELRNDFPINCQIIGDGIEEKNLKSRVKKYGLESTIIFKGRLSRNEVLNEMEKAEVFVMASSPETFGIVYLEAMSKSCYVIACKNEGIDGVIIDGFNGALVSPRNTVELTDSLKRFFKMPPIEKETITNNAKYTAHELSEKKVADKILTDIFSVLE